MSAQKIPELDRIKTLSQFYYYVDALVTWIPEIRVWDWDGETLHERTVYLRITQFYYYFNDPQLEALHSPIAPLEGAELSPISRWLRDFAVEWGEFLGKHLQKGEMFSYFQFGGSDCVVVFERKANVNVTAKAKTHYPIRSQYAVSNINKLARLR